MVFFRVRDRTEVYNSTKFVHYPLRYHETEANTILVILLSTLDEPKELEQLVLVLPRDPNASILY